jgi:amino acid transporter
VTNKRGAPVTALLVVGLVGVITSVFPPSSAMVVFIFLLVLTYELVLIAFLRFRRSPGTVERPYQAVGGSVSGWIGAALALVAALCCYQLEIAALSYALILLGILLLYYFLRRRAA